MRLTGRPFTSGSWTGWLAVVCLVLRAAGAHGEDLASCRKLYLKGDYTACIRQAEQAVTNSAWDDQWPLLLAGAELAVGRYPAAEITITNALERYRASVQLRLLAYDVFNANGQTTRAREMLDEIKLGASRRRYDLDAQNLVAMGKALLLLNAEPKLVLENFFDRAKRLDPDYDQGWLAGGELALDKQDYALAAKIFNEALNKFPDHPDAWFGLARAYAPNDAPQMAGALASVLEYNTNHGPALRLVVDHLVDAEEYAEAEKILARALRVNPWDPEAWAYRAVLAHLRGDPKGEASARQSALKFWSTNPRVDYLIGKKLSQNYRFLEGSAYQRQALEFDPAFLPAKIQLAEDALRLGNEAEGWRLAGEVRDSDGYDVTAYNLGTLREALAKFKTLTNQDFILRMDAREAAIFGDRALELLSRARDRLTQKYGLRPEQPTVVEIFPEQKDFGVRTFGMPHNPGFLGVCFGHVITANSPASQSAHPENWEAVLWHEYCHVITLGITRNKMPRWLSEGISVYEERQANPAWGENLNPRYREMVLGDDLTPVSKLSSAFLAPKSPFHVQFAYFESSLVVEYLVGNFGLDSLKKILADLGDGVEINQAIARHTLPMEKLEIDFAAFARARANDLAPGLDWEQPGEKPPAKGLAGVASALKKKLRPPAPDLSPTPTNRAPIAATSGSKSPSVPTPAQASTNYWILMDQAREALAGKKWAAAKPALVRLIALYPTQTGPECAYALLGAAHRQMGETNQEREVLGKLAPLESDDTATFLRLMELDAAVQDWPGVAENAERFLAVNPLVPQPYRFLAQAAEESGKRESAIRAYERLLLLDAPDPAEEYYRLARLLDEKGDARGAKRQALQALEEAPRFTAALRLLLKLE